MKIQVRRTSGDKPWYYRVLAKNGAVILASEGYSQKANAVRAAWRFRDAVDLDMWELEITEGFSNNKYR